MTGDVCHVEGSETSLSGQCAPEGILPSLVCGELWQTGQRCACR